MSMQLVVFRLCREEYAVLVEKVREVINYLPITKLPGKPDYFEGVINVRGKTVPVIDFAAKLGLPGAGGADRQIIIVEHRNKEIGLTVDTVTEVIQTSKDIFAGLDVTEAGGQNLRKVCNFHDRIIVLLDVEQMLKGSALAG
ncbi:chemotaxis protein CheW [Anaeroselena agilis]|uniref:Chemotaxis protein CheW n=1 Tax=Anaeroselena agilis TaxID=3063788 RepID=A0ABU3NSV2_9FIRM|nr:chemotaxis protein CheW [Selenomonadales bacterium 4137-cl]